MRVCLLGCGWAAELHSRTLRNLRRDVQCSYASRSIEKARALNGKHNGAGAFGSYEDAIASASVDVVAVLTPPASHLQWALRAIGEGKDVILEKPPVLRSDDVDQIAAACQAAGRHVYVAENYYYKPVLARVRDLLAARAVGEPLYIHLNAVKRQKTANWRDAAEQAGGGALFEGGIHWVNFAGALGLTIRSVKAARPGTGTGLERSMALLIEYVEGPVAVLTYSWEVSSRLRGLMRLSRVYGREGGIVFESNGLFVASWGRKSHLSFPLGDIQGYRAMFADFVRAWRQGGDAQMTLARARRDLEVVEEAYRSAGVAMSGVASGHGA
jgi:predicted dehydrogenase